MKREIKVEKTNIITCKIVGKKKCICYVVAVSKDDAVSVVEEKKLNFNLLKEEEYSLEIVGEDVNFTFDQKGDMLDYDIDVNAYHIDISKRALKEADKLRREAFIKYGM